MITSINKNNNNNNNNNKNTWRYLRPLIYFNCCSTPFQSFHSMKRLGVLLLPHDGMLVHHSLPHSVQIIIWWISFLSTPSCIPLYFSSLSILLIQCDEYRMPGCTMIEGRGGKRALLPFFHLALLLSYLSFISLILMRLTAILATKTDAKV